jgi:hypothetical protein
VKPAVLLIGSVLALACAAATAEDEASITVSGLRDPVDKSYRKIMKGRALFDKLHALAPAAALRYRLWPRKRDTDLRSVALAVVGDTFERPVVVAADRTFALERDARALAEDASVRPNRKAGSMTWRADVRTPGLPADTRRLGDLRLECRVGMEAGLVSHYPSLLERFMDIVLGAAAFCDEREPPYLFFADRPLFAVTLVSGERRQTLSIGALYAGLAHDRAPLGELGFCDCEALLDRAYFAPLGDRRWPDDTRVQLEYLDGPAAPNEYSSLAGSAKGEVAALFGEAKVMRFDRGVELWAYDYQKTEVIVLFDATGHVTKARLRPAP